MKTKQSLRLLATAALLFSSTGAMAITQSVTANIAFDSPLTMTKVSDISFGTVKAGVADTYTISTAGAVTNSGSGQWLSGTKTAGNVTLAGSTTQTVNISVALGSANGGVSLANATCAYNGGGSGSCTINGAAAPGTGKTLLLGVDAVVDGTQVAGNTAAPTMTVTVVYP
ncbi:MAG: DUF4402 domain-containing protein [Proteobacteria bacterium]|nr:DUF4402 domain-containing protein [Pseudomonadota bacterium]